MGKSLWAAKKGSGAANAARLGGFVHAPRCEFYPCGEARRRVQQALIYQRGANAALPSRATLARRIRTFGARRF
jgi:hypothetical protein